MHHWTVTSNRLADGSVAYLRSDRVWTDDLQDAWICSEKGAAEPLLEWASAQEHVVCDPYLLAVEYGAEGVVPVSAREKLRAAGPAATLRRLGYGIGRASVQRRRQRAG